MNDLNLVENTRFFYGMIFTVFEKQENIITPLK
jgi:hypothetical protein